VEGKAKNLIEERVHRMVDPLQAQAQASVTAIRIQELIAKANSDDAKAFDELLSLKSSGTVGQRDLVSRVINELHHRAMDWRFPEGQPFFECLDPQSSPCQEAIVSPDSEKRRKAVFSFGLVQRQEVGHQAYDACTGAGKVRFAPSLVKVALNDSLLSIRAPAIKSINAIFQEAPGIPSGGFDLLDTEGLREWWKSNEPNHDALALLSCVRPSAWAGDGISIYEDIQRYEKNSPPSLATEFRKVLTRMRSESANRNKSTTAELERLTRRSSCSEFEGDFETRLRSYREHKASEEGDYLGLYDIEYMKTCPISITLLPQLAEYATTTRRLSVLYGAILVVNQWTGSSLDPYDQASVKDWWAAHKGEYEK
jgi:hypothetical protein